MTEIIFILEEDPAGGFTARAAGEPVFTHADSVEDLRAQVRDAVHSDFEPGQVPSLVRCWRPDS